MVPLFIVPIIFIISTIIAGAITTFFPQLTTWILGSINAADNIYALLIEIPRPLWDNNTYLLDPLVNSTSYGLYTNATSGYSFLIGSSMTNFYGASRTAALILLVFVVAFAGISYFLQNFRLVSEGTATRILMGSVMCIVLIFIFPPVYDVIAATINALTYPGPSGILKPGMIDEILLHASAVFPTGGLSDLGSIIAGIFMNLFLFIFTLITYAGIAIMGILRTFFIGAAFALMPILLVMRLIPVLDRVADIFIQVVVGGILASLIISIFFAFGFDVLTSPTVSGLMKTLIALGVLMASSLMLTFLIPSLGSMMTTITNAITGAAAGAAVGGVTVATGAAAASYQSFRELAPLVTAGRISPTTAFLRSTGAGLGGAAGALGTIFPTMRAPAAALSTGRSAGSVLIKDLLKEYGEDEIGDSLILKAAATPHDKEKDPELMKKWAENVKVDLLNRPPEVIGSEISKMTGLEFKDSEAVGKRVQARIRTLMEMSKADPDTQNILLSRVGRLYSGWKEEGIEKFKIDGALEPFKAYAAVKERKLNADKVSDFIVSRRGMEAPKGEAAETGKAPGTPT
ncbi:MAG: hypothetical protein QXZ09_08805 [Candidatus Methanomethylicaceae archaeon]